MLTSPVSDKVNEEPLDSEETEKCSSKKQMDWKLLKINILELYHQIS